MALVPISKSERKHIIYIWHALSARQFLAPKDESTQ